MAAMDKEDENVTYAQHVKLRVVKQSQPQP